MVSTQVGSWRGSTFVSTLTGNEPTVDIAFAVPVILEVLKLPGLLKKLEWPLTPPPSPFPPLQVDVWDEDRAVSPSNESTMGMVFGPGSYNKAVCDSKVVIFTA